MTFFPRKPLSNTVTSCSLAPMSHLILIQSLTQGLFIMTSVCLKMLSMALLAAGWLHLQAPYSELSMPENLTWRAASAHKTYNSRAMHKLRPLVSAAVMSLIKLKADCRAAESTQRYIKHIVSITLAITTFYNWKWMFSKHNKPCCSFALVRYWWISRSMSC